VHELDCITSYVVDVKYVQFYISVAKAQSL